MEDNKKRNKEDSEDKEIIYSHAIKAGKRIYYLDVKKSRNDDFFLSITESRKIVNGEGEDIRVSYEKHKIFLYKEDFQKFMNGLHDVLSYIHENQHPKDAQSDTQTENFPKNDDTSLTEDIKIDIDF